MASARSSKVRSCVFVFSMYFRRHERHWRVAVFFAGAALAGSLGGILAVGHIRFCA